MLNKRMSSNLVFGDVEIEFIYKKSISGLPTQDFVVDTGYLKVSSPELTSIDLLNYPSYAGGLNHIGTVFSELAKAIDSSKLIELAEKINARYQLQSIGYILEKIDVMDEDKKSEIMGALETFLKGKMKYYIPIASEIDELMATKLRALYQRRKGRDLFDIWYVITNELVNLNQVFDIFSKYCTYNDMKISREVFIKNLEQKKDNHDFHIDMSLLLP